MEPKPSFSVEKPMQDKRDPSEKEQLIALFHEIICETEKQKQLSLAESFHRKLQELILSREERPTLGNPENVLSVLKGEDRFDYLSVSGGTAGQRIYFKKQIEITGDADPTKYGFGTDDISAIPYCGNIRLESSQVRWMIYPEPTESHKHYGEGYWKKFVHVFGDSIIRL